MAARKPLVLAGGVRRQIAPGDTLDAELATKAVADGYASLGSDGKVPTSQLDGTLAALAALVVATDKLIYATGPDTFGQTDLTSVARTLLAQTTQALMRTAGLGMSANGSSLVSAADYAAMKGLLALDSVDNTSDATKNAAVATLTNKTLTAAILGGITDLSGGRVKYPASQIASTDANTLDDFEEGTFTPELRFGGSIAATHTWQDGFYVKLGRVVLYGLSVNISNKGAGTGVAEIYGLPFVAVSTLNGHIVPFVVKASNMASTVKAPVGQVNGNRITIAHHDGAGAAPALTDANFTNTSVLYVAGFYLAPQ